MLSIDRLAKPNSGRAQGALKENKFNAFLFLNSLLKESWQRILPKVLDCVSSQAKGFALSKASRSGFVSIASEQFASGKTTLKAAQSILERYLSKLNGLKSLILSPALVCARMDC